VLGDTDGLTEGNIIGSDDGSALGILGISIGTVDGVDDILDGLLDGYVLESNDGVELGVSDGLIDGNALGADDGSALGLILDTVGSVVGSLVFVATDGLYDT